MGTSGFEVWRVNLASITLSRTDGVGGTVPPFERRRRGRLIRFEDVATAQAGGPCRCLDTGADGIDDRVISFSARQVVEVLELQSLEPGTVVTLALRGRLIDGAEFEAADCVRIAGSAIIRAPEIHRAVRVNPK